MRMIVNMNGTAVSDLINQRRAVMDALSDAMKAMQEMTPNGRDYPGRQDDCKADREIHYARFAQLDKMRNDIMDEALAIQSQIYRGDA
jgi:hypothetical protein